MFTAEHLSLSAQRKDKERLWECTRKEVSAAAWDVTGD
jgi:hypothetical protein